MFSLPANRRILLALCAVAANGIAWGQQSSFNDAYLMNPTLLDPSFAGQLDYQYAMGYQQKWIGIPGAPRSGTFAGDFSTKQFGIQGALLADQAGPLSRVTPSVSVAKTIQLDRDQKLSFGLKGGLDNWSVDFTKPQLDVPIDQAFQQGQTSILLPNIGFGLSYTYKDVAYIGFSALDLSSRAWSPLTSVPSHRHLFAGANIPVNKTNKIRLSGVLNQVDNAPWDLNVHAVWANENWGAAGLVYSPSDGIGVALSAPSTKSYRLFYNYTYPLNPLQAISRQSHTIGISFSPKLKPCSIAGPRYF
jgi:type IX secretion system PorP/SprF family membrane protein